MIINCKEKFAVLRDFERTHCNDPSRRTNRCNSMVHKMSVILADTIGISCVQVKVSEW